MAGRPVWLASIARRDDAGELVATGKWTLEQRIAADDVLSSLLEGLGDPAREVSFRMNITLCRHRGLSEREEEMLPTDFSTFRATDTAGGAVELLWSRGVTGDAIRPCENPGRTLLVPDRPDLFLPLPCGRCDPCRARDNLRAA